MWAYEGPTSCRRRPTDRGLTFLRKRRRRGSATRITPIALATPTDPKRLLAFTKTCGSVTCARNWRLALNAQAGKVALHTTRSRSACCATSSWREARSIKKRAQHKVPLFSSVARLKNTGISVRGLGSAPATHAESRQYAVGQDPPNQWSSDTVNGGNLVETR